MENHALQNIVEKVKLIEGNDYITIEQTHNLNTSEMLFLIKNLKDDLIFQNKKTITLLVDHLFPYSVDETLVQKGFKLHDTFILVKHNLVELDQNPAIFTFLSINDVSSNIFLDKWSKVMQGSLNASSTFTIEEHFQSVQSELGTMYKDSYILAYEGDQCVGGVMPHIEPGTEAEGRLFYFGLLPEVRSKGKARLLHLQALHYLKDHFHADYYIGGTSTANVPMQKVFKHNKCEIVEKHRVYKWIKGD